MAIVKRRTRKIRVRPQTVDYEISYRNYEKLGNFLSDRAKIWGKARTGIPSKQQRKIAKAIKHARHLGLLPFTSRI
jgi:small subunit ribosomal protein S18